MSGGQEKNFSTLGPKLRESKAQQYYGDKQRQIRIEIIDYLLMSHKCLIEMNKNLLGNSSSNITYCTMIEDYKTHLLLHISHKHLVIKLNKLAQCSPPLSSKSAMIEDCKTHPAPHIPSVALCSPPREDHC